ncbi:lysozyme inhibitor LprI family protein [Burkholderia sp. MSMB1459WGS]|uniref:lysozyme inhibitor LprI family protein n=1 Tax=Burkholderia sp. MSMB1459WGS TaxID=1637970 RepID=UPI00211D9E0D|nr:lysozyme inhibitor LprI family protein [Burkholderia sp. MSMB1459WGS]
MPGRHGHRRRPVARDPVHTNESQVAPRVTVRVRARADACLAYHKRRCTAMREMRWRFPRMARGPMPHRCGRPRKTNRLRESMRGIRTASTGRLAGLAAMFMMGVGLAVPGFAMDCSKAVQPIEKRICASPALRAADARMNAAYAGVLQAAPDAAVRDMLVRSQRRWLAARNKRLDTDYDGHRLAVDEVRKAFDRRTAVLADRSDEGLIARALAERQWLAKYSGGPLAGFDANCDFIPDDASGAHVSYACFGAIHVQHHARVCSQSEDWATGAVYQYRLVSAADGGKVHPVAFCEAQGTHACDSGSAQAGWVRAAASGGENRTPAPVAGLPQLDAELWPLGEGGDAAWFDRCLKAPVFPDVDAH